MDKLIVVGKGLLRQPVTAGEASSSSGRTRVRGGGALTFSARVGGLEYEYVYGRGQEMEVEKGLSPSLKPISVGVCAMKTKVLCIEL